MRTQLRRQAAAHTDHVQDVLKVQEHELKAEAEQVIYPRVCLHIRMSTYRTLVALSCQVWSV